MKSDKEVCRALAFQDGILGRRDFLTLVGVGAAAMLTRPVFAARPGPASRKPNLVVVLADDLGYADIGVHGRKDIPTPSIDSVARNGVRFTNAYVSCPVCSPTRAGIMTGRYQQRFGHWYNPGPAADADTTFGLPLSETTVADLLKQAGYRTGMVGKWHLGLRPEFHPMKRGFEEYFGFLNGAHSYLDPHAAPRNPILRGTEPVDEKEYLTDAFTREAVAYIDRHATEPFFLYLCYNAVHAPMQATAKYLDRFPNIADAKRRRYAAMLSAMDDGIGAVLEALQRNRLEKDTLVIFLSDNGGPPQANASDNTPLRGSKNTIQEGGIRVPLLMQWPRRLPRGKVYERPVISLDILPTCVAAAGGALPSSKALDGVDLVPYVTGKRGAPHDMLFWKWHEGSVVRHEKWKLFKDNDGAVTLYNLSKDIGESRDVSGKHPKRVREMAEALTRWESQLKPPLWKRGAGAVQNPRFGRRTRAVS
jgi:arylsulfatase A-like enzyme